ncbi:MAG: TonB-dependent receptor plug domain-containing protein [Massilia sp.]
MALARSVRSVLSFTFVGLSATAAAQQTPPAKAASVAPVADTAVKQVDIKGALADYDARRDDTASKSVMKSDEIERLGFANVVELLQRMPGITVVTGGNRANDIRMRGLGSGYTQILLNGERVAPGFSIDTIAPNTIDRIEVMRAGTADVSAQGIAGTINIVLKKVVKQAEREFRFGTGSSDGGGQSPRFTLLWSDRSGALSYSVTSALAIGNFERTSPYTERFTEPDGTISQMRTAAFHDDGHSERLTINPRLNWALANGDVLTSQTNLNVSRARIDSDRSDSTTVGTPSQYPLIVDQDRRHGHNLQSDLTLVHKIATDASLEVKLGASFARQYDKDAQSAFVAVDGAQLLDQQVRVQGRDHALNSTGKYRLGLGQGHRFASGWDISRSVRQDARQADSSEPANVADELSKATIDRAAAYAQDEWEVTPRWSVYLGLRWEGILTDVSSTGQADVKSRSAVWSPVFQTLYKLPDRPGEQLRLALNRSYRPPTLQNLSTQRFISLYNSKTELDFTGNPHLRPELSTGLDAAYEHFWKDGRFVSVSVYARGLSDIIGQDTFESTPGHYVSRPVNQGRGQAHGVELEAKFPLRSVFAAAPALEIKASAAANWSTVDSVPGPENRLGHQTPLSASLGLDYSNGRFSTGTQFAYAQGCLYRESLTRRERQRSRRDFDIFLRWKADAKTELGLYMNNVLGQDGYSDRLYTDATGTMERVAIFPAKINVRVTLQTKF